MYRSMGRLGLQGNQIILWDQRAHYFFIKDRINLDFSMVSTLTINTTNIELYQKLTSRIFKVCRSSP